MPLKTKPVPDGYTAVTPYLTIKGAAAAIEFYKKAFGAVENYRMNMPDGRIAHAEIRIDDAIVMLHDEMPEMNSLSPQTVGGTSSSLMLYVADVDKVFAQALAAGGISKMDVADQFYGDRSGSITDPFGHQWMISTHVEDVSEEEVARRGQKFFASSA